MTESYRKYWSKYKIISVIYCGLILIGGALTLLKVKLGFLDGWAVFLVIVLVTLAYLDGFIRKLFKLLKDKE